MEVMRRELADSSVQLTVTSPPYDNLRKYNGYSWDFEATARELYRVTKKGGVVVWVVGDQTKNGSESGTSFRQALYFKEVGFNLHDTMIYEKSGMAYPEANRYHNTFEYMFVFGKQKILWVNLIKDRENLYQGYAGGNKRGGLCFRGKYGARFNIWRFPNGRDNNSKDRLAFQHPAIFPEALAQDHIKSWSNAGDLVLDPFVGSGTTGKMAKLLGREFVGIDISKEYVALARERIRKAKP